MSLHPVVAEVTARVIARSRESRQRYLRRIDAAHGKGPQRGHLSCSNIAHGFAACNARDKAALRDSPQPNIGIVTAYNDMLSAHQPYAGYPDAIRALARAAGATAQVAGGVPAMCDGVTQGRAGMELSLFSRDVIALATSVALSHDMFDAVLCLGICDKIVPGLLIGALAFGHLPTVFVPAGPMPSGLPNEEKSRIRQLHAEGKASREQLLDAEARSYHAPGTCTFYGTANSNQMLMEIMGLHVPGASFVNTNTPLREALTAEAVHRAVAMAAADAWLPVGHVVDERAIVNGVIGLHATGGSTNHLMHLVAIARAAGIELSWDDFAALSGVVPLLAHVYPNGSADVNHFHAAGGMGFLIAQLGAAGLLHMDIDTVAGTTLAAHAVETTLGADGAIVRMPAPQASRNEDVLRGTARPFRDEGGLRVLDGNLGRATMKVSAVPEDRFTIEAPARVFDEQEQLRAAFERGELDRDFVAVLRFQGPRANGMPELHKLTPPLSVLQKRGYRVALVTDGRMSGASGRIPAAIHVTPEAAAGGAIGRIRDGDIVRVDATTNTLSVKLDAAELAARPIAPRGGDAHHLGMGRELFAGFRAAVGPADRGASIFGESP